MCPSGGHAAGSPPAPAVRTEFAVVGGGITGLSAAWALHRLGRDVVVLEQATVGHAGGGSHGACRIFRLGYDDPQYVTLALRARALWTEAEQDSGERLLHPTPQLTFGPQLPAVRDAMLFAGAACEQLGRGQAAERFGGIATVGPVLLEPESAVIAADRALAALAALAGLPDQAGRTGLPAEGVRVTALADDGRRVMLRTSAGDVEARRAIVCAGPWTAGLLASAGIALPAEASLEQVAYLSPAAARPDMPIFVHYGGEFPYGLPVPGSAWYKIGIHHGGPAVHPDHQDQAADAALGLRIEDAARRILPAHDPHPVAVERCVYDNSPDTDFVVDRIGNVVIGAGTSGHGFKFGPLLGAWLAWLATSGTGRRPASWPAAPWPAEPPARFALSRF